VDGTGAVHVAWRDYTDYGGAGSDADIFYKNWTTTAGWSLPQVVSAESTGDSENPSLAVDAAGTVHVAWHDFTDYGGAGADVDIFYKNWTAAAGWSLPLVVSAESTGHSQSPSLAVDAAGAVHVAWYDGTDYGGAGTDWDVFYKNWTVAAGWSLPQVVSAESTGYSIAPSLTVDAAGTVHVAWQDETDYGGAGLDYDIFYKNWTAAAGWSLPQVVSAESTTTS
jgi:hypothetical protein